MNIPQTYHTFQVKR